jgi:hypothetical protein
MARTWPGRPARETTWPGCLCHLYQIADINQALRQLRTIKDDLKIGQVVNLRDCPLLRDLVGELWAEIEWFVEVTGTSKFFENAYG